MTVEDLLHWKEGIEENLAQLGDETFELRDRLDRIKLDNSTAMGMLRGRTKRGLLGGEKGSNRVAPGGGDDSETGTSNNGQESKRALVPFKGGSGNHIVGTVSVAAAAAAASGGATGGGGEAALPLPTTRRAKIKRFLRWFVPSDLRDFSMYTILCLQLAISAPLFFELYATLGSSVRKTMI